MEIEGVGTVRLGEDMVRTLQLEAGVMVDAQVLERVQQAAAREEARVIALRLLQRRFRSRAEVERALRRRHITGETMTTVVAQLRRDGWIDDARFARSWVRDRTALSPRGPRRLRAELLSKGVAPEVADEAIGALLPRALEDALAAAQVEARLPRLRRLPPPIARRRLAAWLQRRGFSGDVIARLLRAMPPTSPDRPDVDPAA